MVRHLRTRERGFVRVQLEPRLLRDRRGRVGRRRIQNPIGPARRPLDRVLAFLAERLELVRRREPSQGSFLPPRRCPAARTHVEQLVVRHELGPVALLAARLEARQKRAFRLEVGGRYKSKVKVAKEEAVRCVVNLRSRAGWVWERSGGQEEVRGDPGVVVDPLAKLAGVCRQMAGDKSIKGWRDACDQSKPTVRKRKGGGGGISREALGGCRLLVRRSLDPDLGPGRSLVARQPGKVTQCNLSLSHADDPPLDSLLLAPAERVDAPKEEEGDVGVARDVDESV